MAEAGDGLLRMRDVCARTGLTRATVHHYIREGVLPKPTKTGRNTAVYDEDFVHRARLVKTLQEKTHMPLAAIRDTINAMPSGAVETIDPERVAGVTATIAANLRLTSAREVSRKELLALTKLRPIELDGIASVGLVEPIERGGKTYYSPWDARIAHAIARIRDAGAAPERGFVSPLIVDAYRKHLADLARIEAKEMVRMLRPLAETDLDTIVQQTLEPLGDLITAMHHKELVDAVTKLTNNGGSNGSTGR